MGLLNLYGFAEFLAKPFFHGLDGPSDLCRNPPGACSELKAPLPGFEFGAVARRVAVHG